jgi:hypothetical protein
MKCLYQKANKHYQTISLSIEKASVTTERNGGGLLEKQGENNGVKELLLCGVPEVVEWKECSIFFWRND